ncbi:MAG: alpha/beta hydrolase [Thomasclavelia sp.]|nr:alpha/beta hydrolase [Thomasclavelia sp.]
MKNNSKKLIGLAGVAAVASAAGATVAFANKTSTALMYRHHKEDDRPSILESKYQGKDVYIKNTQGVNLHGVLLEKEGAKSTVLVTHPFALDCKDMSLYVPFLKEKLPDSNFLLIDSCAHGQSDGYIRGFGIKDVDDLVKWNDYILKTFGEDQKIIMFGKECGANTILNASGKHLLKNVSCIISDGAYTSPYDILGYRVTKDYYMPTIPVMPIVSAKVKKAIKINLKNSTIDKVRHNDIPTLYVHTKTDDFVPLKMVYQLYNNNRGPKTLFILKDEKYLFELLEDDDYKKTLDEFLKQYL